MKPLVKAFVTVEHGGKLYDVTLYDNGGAIARQHTKRGLRTLTGYGRAYRVGMFNTVVALAIEKYKEALR